jgi:rfaE bifunctional protein kinase chain/domain
MSKNILVVGDIIIDHYIDVVTSRKAEESNINVYDEVKNYYRLGGAANVANNVRSLFKFDDVVNVYLMGIAGLNDTLDIRVDSFGNIRSTVSDLIRDSGIDESLLNFYYSGDTMIKSRYTNSKNIIFRSDNKKIFNEKNIEHFNETFFSRLSSRAPYDIVIISDYDKGTISKNVTDHIFDLNVPVIVDSKRYDLEIFNGADVIKLNEFEYYRQVSGHLYSCPEKLCKNLVVTRGSKGCELRVYDSSKSKDNEYVTHIESFPVNKVDSVDVTGCGDTHTASMAYSLLFSKDIRKAIEFANKCSSVVVTKFGTSTINDI